MRKKESTPRAHHVCSSGLVMKGHRGGREREGEKERKGHSECVRVCVLGGGGVSPSRSFPAPSAPLDTMYGGVAVGCSAKTPMLKNSPRTNMVLILEIF